MSVVIKPEVGRTLHFFRSPESPPFAAKVCGVNGSGTINVAFWDETGTAGNQMAVRLVQPNEPTPAAGAFARWMPFTVAQASAAAAVAEPVDEGPPQGEQAKKAKK